MEKSKHLESLSNFHIAFMMHNPTMNRWDYSEQSYGSWQVTQTVSFFNETLGATVTQDRTIPYF
jgi:benzoyl-CoA reductase/2-hydroxyglutaryl-CoA dehydratase subunit BcrC/BadD/HgdB